MAFLYWELVTGLVCSPEKPQEAKWSGNVNHCRKKMFKAVFYVTLLQSEFYMMFVLFKMLRA